MGRGVSTFSRICCGLIFAAALALAEEKLPEGRGKAAVEKVCGACHSTAVLFDSGHDRGGWQDVIDEMVVLGAKPSKAEMRVILDYLAKNFPRPLPKK